MGKASRGGEDVESVKTTTECRCDVMRREIWKVGGGGKGKSYKWKKTEGKEKEKLSHAGTETEASLK